MLNRRNWIADGLAALWPRLTMVLWLAPAFAGWVLLMLPEGPRHALISRGDWRIEGGFFENWRPDESDVHQSILRNQEARFFRSWSPETGPVPGRIETAPFLPPRYLGIPVSGSPYDPDISIWIECLANSNKLPVATGHLQEGWVEQILPVPADWCSSNARLVAESTSTNQFVCLGTPFAASRIAYMKGSAPVILFVQTVVLTPLAVLACALVLPLLRWGWEHEIAVMGAAVGVCLWGYINFFAAYFDPRIQITAAMFTLLLAVAAIYRWRKIAALELRRDEIRRPLAVFAAVAVAAVFAVYAVETGSGGWSPNYRFAPAIWSSDNQLQPMISEMLYREWSVLNWNPLWQTSDRPPLLSGVLLLSRPWWELFLGVHDNKRLLDLFYQCAAISLMAFWVVPIWYLVRKLKLARWRELAVLLLFATSPFIVFNTIYSWPKLLAGWLAIISFTLIIQRPLDRGRRVEPAVFILGAAAAALAILSHSGIAFGLLPVAVAILIPRFWPGWKPVILGAFVAAALLAPWTLWQNLVDPPGNHLLKNALAGTYGQGENHIGLWETIERRYDKLSLEEWAQTRWTSVQQLFLGFWRPTGAPSAAPGDLSRRLRRDDLLFVVPSMRILNLGWLLLLGITVTVLRGRRMASCHGAALLMTVLGTAGILLSCLVTFLVPIVANISYLSIMFLLLALATAICSTDWRLVTAVAIAHVAYMAVVWGLSPLEMSVNNRADIIVGWIISAVAAAHAALRPDRGPAATFEV